MAALNEHRQKFSVKLVYEELDCEGVDHNKTFSFKVVIDGKSYPKGVGKTKKDARHDAAKNAWEWLFSGNSQDSEPSMQSSAAEASDTQTSMNYICWLNEYGQKNEVKITPVETTKPGLHNTTLCCKFLVGDKEYPMVCGKTKREAKEEAAKLVYDMIRVNESKTANKTENYASGQQNPERHRDILKLSNMTSDMSLNSNNSSFSETNYIGIINHYCQKTNRSPVFIEDGRCGPPHDPQFSYKLEIAGKQYPVGEGKSVKEARQNAAQLAWLALQEESDYDSKVSCKSTASEDGAPSATSNSNEASSQNTTKSERDPIIVKNPIRKPSVDSRFTKDYDSVEPLGEGGFGCVYKARNILVDKWRAVKIVEGEG